MAFKLIKKSFHPFECIKCPTQKSLISTQMARRKEIRVTKRINALSLHRIHVIESRGTQQHVCVSSFRWSNCLVLLSTACCAVTESTDWQWNPTLTWEGKAFSQTLAWFLYEVQCHTRWACSLGSLQNLTLNTINNPMALQIYSKKLSHGVFLAQDAGPLIQSM